jgi:hypothetical protein
MKVNPLTIECEIACTYATTAPLLRGGPVTPPCSCDKLPAMEAPMNWFVHLWRRIDSWMHRRAMQQSEFYLRSNLRGRHR